MSLTESLPGDLPNPLAFWCTPNFLGNVCSCRTGGPLSHLAAERQRATEQRPCNQLAAILDLIDPSSRLLELSLA